MNRTVLGATDFSADARQAVTVLRSDAGPPGPPRVARVAAPEVESGNADHFVLIQGHPVVHIIDARQAEGRIRPTRVLTSVVLP